MTSREQVAAAINKKTRQPVPRGEITIDDAIVRQFLNVNRVGFEERKQFVLSLGQDLISLSPSFPALERSRFRFPPSVDDSLWQHIEEWVERSDLFVFLMLDGAFAWGCRLQGVERFLYNLIKKPEHLSDLVQGVEQLNLKIAELALAHGVMGIVLADDIAYQKNLMFAPEILRRFFFPSLNRQIQHIHSHSVPVFFHSDGNLNLVLEDLVACGFDGLQGIESGAGMDIASIAQKYGSRLCLWGNLDPTCLTTEMSSQAVTRAVASLMDKAATIPGFIFGTSSGLFNGMRMENLKAAYMSTE